MTAQRFASVLGMLLSGGFPLETALALMPTVFEGERERAMAQRVSDQVLDGETVQKLQDVVKRVPVAPHVIQYAAALARMSRPKEPGVPDFVKELVGWGAGPRASQHLISGAKANALMCGKFSPDIEDVRRVAVPVLRHRLVKNYSAQAEGLTIEEIIHKML